MTCAHCGSEASPKLSTSGHVVCPDCGAEGKKVGLALYCPGCQDRPGMASPDARGRATCCRCGALVVIWPADLPLPTEAHVRTLQASLQVAVSTNHGLMKVAAAVLNMGELQGAEARFGRRLPASNAKGWWN